MRAHQTNSLKHKDRTAIKPPHAAASVPVNALVVQKAGSPCRAFLTQNRCIYAHLREPAHIRRKLELRVAQGVGFLRSCQDSRVDGEYARQRAIAHGHLVALNPAAADHGARFAQRLQIVLQIPQLPSDATLAECSGYVRSGNPDGKIVRPIGATVQVL